MKENAKKIIDAEFNWSQCFGVKVSSRKEQIILDNFL